MPPRKRGRKPNGAKSDPVNPVNSEPDPVKPVDSEPEPVQLVESKPEEEEDNNEERESDEYEEEEEIEYEEVEEEIEEYETEEEEEEDVKREDNKERENVERESDEEKEIHKQMLKRPPQGSEIYIGNIPYNTTEEELRSFCEPHGGIFEVRVMKDKGFAFVCYKSETEASKAIKALHNSDFKGKKIRCSASQSKNRIFIGNLPRKWEESDLKNAVNKVGPGVIRVDVLMDSMTKRSRGFGFVEYYNHACADYSLKIMSKNNFKFENNNPTVSWADPRGNNSETDTKSKIKAVYVKNLPQDVSENKLRDLFENNGEIEKIVLPPLKTGHDKRYAFVHFKNRADALKSVENNDKYVLDGEVVECSMAKPPNSEKKFVGSTNQRPPPPVMSHYPPRSAMMGYGAIPPYMPPPMMAPPGVAMVPMVLPDGRLGYVLQQPSGTGHRGANNNNYNYGNNSYNNNNNYRGGKRGYDGHSRGGGPNKRYRH